MRELIPDYKFTKNIELYFRFCNQGFFIKQIIKKN